LIGPNGAGKTTLLNLISGLYKCDKGDIYICGKNVTTTPPYKRARMGLARTFQQPRFMQRSSIRDNLLVGTDLANQIGYFRSFFGVKGADFESELEELLEIVGFKINWNDDILSLPYGQRKLLEIVRAMLAHPKIALIDEPAAGLNDIEIERVIKMIELMKKKEMAIVLIEHKMDMVMNICNNILVLNFGKVIAYGKPKEVALDPMVQEAYLGRKK
ncbi:MAG: ATP-binding cassette domain-containing protein, partial [Petrimonas sp.]|nr:ATP-binding cassette domain-containing protein [Petrimonas sp.]